MVPSRLRFATTSLIAAASLLLSGCLTSIDDACSSIAETHCANCYSCADDVDGVSGAELCDVPPSESDTRAACETFLTDLCEREARTRQDPFGELDQCETTLDEETCGELVEREALDRPAPPEVCQQFL